MRAVQRSGRPRRRSFLRNERGAVLVFVGIGLPMFLGMIALVYDIGLMRLHQTRLQITADAAAMAAAQQAADPVAAEAAARRAADANYPLVLPPGGVQFVHWNTVARAVETVDAGAGRPANAVEVVTRRDAGTNSVLPFVFARAAGLQGDGFSLAASAVALIQQGGGCGESTGIFSASALALGSSSSHSSVCLFGRNGVSLGDSVVMDDATAVIAADLAAIDEPARSSHGAASDLALVLPAMVGQIVADLAATTAEPDAPEDLHTGEIEQTRQHGTSNTPANNQPHLCSGGRSSNACSASDPFTHHAWNRSGNQNVNISIPNNVTWRNLILETDGNVSFGQGVTLENVTIWAGGSVTVGNNAVLNGVAIRAAVDVTVGGAQPANNVEAAGLSIWAGGDIDFAAQNSTLSDMVLHAGNDITFAGRGSGSGQTTTAEGVTVSAGRNVTIRNNVDLYDLRAGAGGRFTVDDSNNGNLDIQIGRSGACAANGAASAYENYIFARGALYFGDHAELHGVQVGGLSSLSFGRGAVVNGSSAEVPEAASVGADATVTGCPKTSDYGAVDSSSATVAAAGSQTALVR